MSPCKICGGELVSLGRVGDLYWMKCRACGLLHSKRATEPQPESEE